MRPATLVSIAVLLVVLSPIIQNHKVNPIDGFPLSYFPMFTGIRGGRTTVTHPVGILSDGSTVDLHYRVAGSGGMNKVRSQIRRRVGVGEARELCVEIAREIRLRRRDYPPGMVEVALVHDQYRFEDFFAGRRNPFDREFIARVEFRPAETDK